MMRRSGLGRGLDALLPPTADEGLERRTGTATPTAAVDRIRPNPLQPRRSFEPDALHELTASIRELGVLQPLLVRPDGDGYELIAGERRWRAAIAAGLTEVPVVVVETDERGSLERALVENIHRADLDPIEEAAAYRQLMDEAGLTQEALGDKLGRNRVTITNALRLLDLPVEIQGLLTSGRLTAGHGRALLGLQGNPLQQRIARRAATESLSVREVEDLVRRYQAMTGSAPARAPGGAAASAAAMEAQRILADHLQTRVRVEVGKRKGRIVLDFVSPAELQRLLHIITGARAEASADSEDGEALETAL
ncbi:MAG: ParB/RepB/Spo0J family partition protein [Actinomycetota bacterium]|nr:ParB/RepB/Spo0J family partition protein [Actinomycetota bacterium]